MEDLRDLTFDLDQDGTQVRRQLDRLVLESRGWATVLFLYEDRARSEESNASNDTWKPPRIAVVRFRRVDEGWRKHATFTLSDPDEISRLGATLGVWAKRIGAIPSTSS